MPLQHRPTSILRPPAARLYRHALESIFAFLNQRELATALQVSSSWLAAVKSMASLQLTLEQTSVSLRVVADSAMGRHVAQIGTNDNYMLISADSLFIAARLMPQLRRLSCNLQWTPTEGPVTFPLGLLELHLLIIDSPAAADINAALRVISRLPLLETFGIYLKDFDEQISFAPLSSLLMLRELTINQLVFDDDAPATELSDAQVAELRALPLLRELDVRPMSAPLLRRLLAQPHELQWQRITPPNPLDDEVAALLPLLSSLTELDEPLPRVTCSRFAFLRQLPRLTLVFLRISEPSAAGRIDSLMEGLPCCSQIEFLSLISTEISAAHLSELLPRLPRLRKLILGNSRVETLSFLAQPPMTQQLTSLVLGNCKQLPLTELRHVHSLRSLETLRLTKSFDAPMDALSQSLYTPPSLLMSQLEKFEYTPPDP